VRNKPLKRLGCWGFEIPRAKARVIIRMIVGSVPFVFLTYCFDMSVSGFYRLQGFILEAIDEFIKVY
jgi:hypothetical protein